MNPIDKRFITAAGVTLVFLYLVILAGSVVRASGSGMGCPDWPRCFGYYIPPTDPMQLDFHPSHEYTKGMMIIEHDTLWRAKEKFTSGTTFTYDHWEKYPVHNYAKFVVAQTWTEYINRLLGALSGFASIILLVYAFRRWKKDKVSLGLVLLHLFVIGFVAWLGKVVVDTHLKPAIITMHMLCAIVMVFIMIIIRYRAMSLAGTLEKISVGSGLRTMAIAALVVTLGQIILGTQVRQEIDHIYKSMDGSSRETWIEQLSSRYSLHFSLAMAMVVLYAILWFVLRKTIVVRETKMLLNASVVIIICAYGAGVIMHNFGIPAYIQPMHLLSAMILAGVQFALVLRLKK